MQRLTGVCALALGLGLAAILPAGRSFGQTPDDYPSRNVTIVMPLAAGSAGDVLGRLVGNQMAAALGRPFVIENVTGASGQIGIDRVNRAEPDGYTLLGSGDNQLIYTPLFTKRSTFDPLSDFEPITQLAVLDWALVVNPEVPAKTVAELIALAKAKPGQLNFSSGGVGSAQQVAMELFMAKTGTKLTHIPYRGVTPALNDVVAGVVPVMFTAVSVAAPFLGSGRLRVLATSGATRSKLLPAIPTLTEAGVEGFQFDTWVGLLAPGKTPPAIVDRLQQAAAAAVSNPSVQPQMAAGGFTPVGNTPAQFKATIARDYERIGAVMKSTGIGGN